jgi:hypothetical protein
MKGHRVASAVHQLNLDPPNATSDQDKSLTDRDSRPSLGLAHTLPDLPVFDTKVLSSRIMTQSAETRTSVMLPGYHFSPHIDCDDGVAA